MLVTTDQWKYNYLKKGGTIVSEQNHILFVILFNLFILGKFESGVANVSRRNARLAHTIESYHVIYDELINMILTLYACLPYQISVLYIMS